MEPAADGRDDPALVRADSSRSAPQWSPPLMGGMTPDPGAERRAPVPGAAMEPAADGRDDVGVRGRGGLPRAAAMEPAADGRDDDLWHEELTHMEEQPQWSPPLM